MSSYPFSPYVERVQTLLKDQLSYRQGIDPVLHEAMQYSLLNGGKRLRPTLVYLACELFGGELVKADKVACAIEAIHSYSLVHDDLPAMDDDALRRGMPTCHIKYGDATAILVGDALLTWAFELLSEPSEYLNSATQLEMIQLLARSSGDLGMVDGQAFDLRSEGQPLSLEQLQAMHEAKTGALIRAALQLGALASERATSQSLAQLDRFARALGLAFQIQDDILDIESTTADLGKQQGADLARNKITYPALIGLEESKKWLQQLYGEAVDALSNFGDEKASLIALADFVITRRQ